MDRHGFIHEKLDIKILILFVLRRLPAPVSMETLFDLVLVDGGFDYFEFTQCLTELVNTEHIINDEEGYRISPKGTEHGDTVESSIPYSVRKKAEKKAEPLINKMKRDSLIGTEYETLPDGTCRINLSLSDGVGEIISLSLIGQGQEQAKTIKSNFRKDAEGYYLKIIKLLSEK